MHNITFAIQANTKKKGRENGAITFSSMSESFINAPKTESSNRTIYLPNAVVEELKKVKIQQEEYKRLLGYEYHDYGLVVAQLNGHPYEHRVIDKQFAKLIAANQFRPVVFHSLRHSSTSLKLKLSRGNIKAVQGDTGHAGPGW